MKIIILAGGKGTRLRPYTTILPKPLMPLGDMSILEIILRQLHYYDFKKVILSVGYMSEILQAMFGNGEKLGIEIEYLHENEPLGTAGALGLLDTIEEDIMLINGDTLTTLDYAKLVKFHQSECADATITTYTRDIHIDFGVLELDEQNRLTEYIEKPVYHFPVSMGVNIFSPSVKRYIKKGEKIDFPDLIRRMKSDGKKILCFRDDFFWLDIGRVEDYQNALDIFEEKRELFLKNKI